jgi:hypothetical protein
MGISRMPIYVNDGDARRVSFIEVCLMACGFLNRKFLCIPVPNCLERMIRYFRTPMYRLNPCSLPFLKGGVGNYCRFVTVSEVQVFTCMRLAILLFVSLFSLNLCVDAKVLHSIIVIGKSKTINVGTTLNGTNQLTENIANSLGYQNHVEIIDFNEDSTTMDSFGDKFRHMIFAPDDVVFFYYAGSGERSSQDESPFPQFSVKGSLDYNMSSDSLVQILLDKGALFYLFIYDTSNKESEFVAPKPTIELQYKNDKSDVLSFDKLGSNPTALNRLFSQKGYVVIGAAKKGCYAYNYKGDPILIQVLCSELSSPKRSWNEIAKDITRTFKRLSKKSKINQIPFFKIFLNDSSSSV